MKFNLLNLTSAIALAVLSMPAFAQHQHMPGMQMPAPPPQPPQKPIAAEPMPMAKPAMEHGDHAMTGALGPYPMTRESSGTAWQPDASGHSGLMSMSDEWMLMAHGTLNLVYDHQSGPRGDDKTFTSGMLMGMASHALGDGTVQFGEPAAWTARRGDVPA